MIARYDLVIVGGSFAGLACARTAALRGLKVAVVDRKPEPGAHIRTTGIIVKEASDEFDLPAQLMRKVRGVRLYAPDDRTLDLSAPRYFFQATDTAGILRWMAAEAERAGAHLLYGRKFETALTHNRGVTIPGLGLHARFLIGTDGARSRVAGVTQIGVAARRPAKPALGGLFERLKPHCDIRQIRVISRRSGLIPSGGVVKRLGAERVLLVGDAAGTVSPVTGGGIHTALHFGRRAAHMVADYLDDRGTHPAAALAREVPRYRLKRMLRAALDTAPPNALINAMLMTAPMRSLAQRLYFHRRGGDAASFEAWSRAFEADDMSPVPPLPPPPKLRCI